MDIAVKYADDIRRMMDINSAPAGIDNCIGTVRKIEDSLGNAKRRIPDAKSALEDLRNQLPRPASVTSSSRSRDPVPNQEDKVVPNQDGFFFGKITQQDA